MRTRAALPLFVAVACLVGSAHAQPSEPTSLPIALTVAELEGEAVITPAWIDEQVENANTIFHDHGAAFTIVDRATMGEEHARMEDRGDRHQLGHLLHRQRIDVFVVASLRDVDDPSRYRQGVHWRPRGEEYTPGSHFVIISRIAGPTVLAHELGHYFGNPHSDTPGNIMSYERGDVPPFFDAVQSRRIGFSMRRMLRRGELVTAPAL
ncbi:MAG: hypothetical protein AB7S26_39590 [Sandaracinaceae bacterium]